MRDVKASVTLSTYRNDLAAEGEEKEATSSGTAYMMGIFLGMMLYMFLLIYGSRRCSRRRASTTS